MAQIRPLGREFVTPAGKAACCIILLLALCACQRQPEASLHMVAAAPAGTPSSIQRLAAASDSYISSWSPDSHYAASKTLAVRSDGGKATLLRFEMPQATAATLNRAVLRLYVLRAGSVPLTLRASALSRPWDARAANWRQAASGKLWSLPGASDAGRDRAAEPAAMALAAHAESWLELDLTAQAREWLARPDGNYGLLLTGSALELVVCEFASSESRPDQAPFLELTFSAERAGGAESRAADGGDILCGSECGLADTMISASFPESNLAAAPSWELTGDGGRAVLIRLTALPKKGAPAQATLQLYVVSGGPGKIEISAHQLARDWHPQQATWQRALASAKWAAPGAQSPGADIAPSVASIAALNRAGGWLELDITALVVSWLEHPELNDGLILRASAASPLSYTFASAESPLLEQRPRVKLVYR